jgi:hypothetical protein
MPSHAWLRGQKVQFIESFCDYSETILHSKSVLMFHRSLLGNRTDGDLPAELRGRPTLGELEKNSHKMAIKGGET